MKKTTKFILAFLEEIGLVLALIVLVLALIYEKNILAMISGGFAVFLLILIGGYIISTKKKK